MCFNREKAFWSFFPYLKNPKPFLDFLEKLECVKYKVSLKKIEKSLDKYKEIFKKINRKNVFKLFEILKNNDDSFYDFQEYILSLVKKDVNLFIKLSQERFIEFFTTIKGTNDGFYEFNNLIYPIIDKKFIKIMKDEKIRYFILQIKYPLKDNYGSFIQEIYPIIKNDYELFMKFANHHVSYFLDLISNSKKSFSNFTFYIFPKIKKNPDFFFKIANKKCGKFLKRIKGKKDGWYTFTEEIFGRENLLNFVSGKIGKLLKILKGKNDSWSVFLKEIYKEDYKILKKIGNRNIRIIFKKIKNRDDSWRTFMKYLFPFIKKNLNKFIEIVIYHKYLRKLKCIGFKEFSSIISFL